MAISFYCESCYQLVETSDETANKKGRCPHCGQIQMIPAASTAVSAPRSRPPRSTVDALLEDVHQLSDPGPSESTGRQKKAGDWRKSRQEKAWGDDRFGSRYVEEMERIDRTSRALAIPAIGIILCSVLLFVASGITTVVFALFMAGTAANEQFSPTYGIIMLVLVGWNCMIATLGIVGANHMKQVRSYSMAVGGALLMCLPHAVWPLGLLFGIWAVILLAQADNRNNFRKA